MVTRHGYDGYDYRRPTDLVVGDYVDSQTSGARWGERSVTLPNCRRRIYAEEFSQVLRTESDYDPNP
jgi:hypothetical protein